jgi:hypothetical protein
MPQRSRQVNLRLSESQFRVLEALAVLQRRPRAEVLRLPVSSFLEKHADDPDVQEVMELLRARETENPQDAQ